MLEGFEEFVDGSDGLLEGLVVDDLEVLAPADHGAELLGGGVLGHAEQAQRGKPEVVAAAELVPDAQGRDGDLCDNARGLLEPGDVALKDLLLGGVQVARLHLFRDVVGEHVAVLGLHVVHHDLVDRLVALPGTDAPTEIDLLLAHLWFSFWLQYNNKNKTD